MQQLCSGVRFIFKPRRAATLTIVIVTLFLLAGIPAFAQCAMCQGSTAATSDGGAVYNHSTLFMLCVPYLLLAGVAGYVVYAFRRVRPASSAGDPGTASPGATATSKDSEG
jgi:hypothetical protein